MAARQPDLQPLQKSCFLKFKLLSDSGFQHNEPKAAVAHGFIFIAKAKSERIYTFSFAFVTKKQKQTPVKTGMAIGKYFSKSYLHPH